MTERSGTTKVSISPDERPTQGEPELLLATSGGLGERLNDVVDHTGPEAGDVVRKAGREDRIDLFVPHTRPRRSMGKAARSA